MHRDFPKLLYDKVLHKSNWIDLNPSPWQCLVFRMMYNFTQWSAVLRLEFIPRVIYNSSFGSFQLVYHPFTSQYSFTHQVLSLSLYNIDWLEGPVSHYLEYKYPLHTWSGQFPVAVVSWHFVWSDYCFWLQLVRYCLLVYSYYCTIRTLVFGQ